MNTAIQARDPSIFPSRISMPPETLLSVTHLITPTKPHHSDLLAISPKTQTERELLQVLQENQHREAPLKTQIRDLAATNILTTLYCKTLHGNLARYGYEKKKFSGVKPGRLVGDGLPRLSRGDDFYQRVVEFVKWEEREDKKKKKKARERRMKTMQRWRDDDPARKRPMQPRPGSGRTRSRSGRLRRHRLRPFGVKVPARGKAIPKPPVTAEC